MSAPTQPTQPQQPPERVLLKGGPAWPTPPPKPPKQKRFGLAVVLLTAVGSWVIGFLMAMFVITAGGVADVSTTTAGPTATVTERVVVTATVTAGAPIPGIETPKAPEPEPKPEPKPEPIGDGTYLVGSEIARGQWKSSGEGGGLCYADTQTKGGTILEQEVSNGAPVVIRIGKSAYTFETSGCGTWKKVG